MTTLTDRIEQLRLLGVNITHDHEYRGKPGKDRVSVDLPDTVTHVAFPITPTEWVWLGQRDSEGYIGPCCGNTGMVQDHMNAAFRDGGGFSVRSLSVMGRLLRTHDGWEWAAGEFDVDKALEPSRWESPPDGRVWTFSPDEHVIPEHLTPWDKVCVLHAALEPAMRLGQFEEPHKHDCEDESDEPGRNAIRTLRNALEHLSWADLFTPREGDDSRLLQRQVMLAKLYQPTQWLSRTLDELVAADPLEGFAIVTPGTDAVLENAAGQCIYAARESAEKVVELWKREETRESARRKHGEDVHEPEYVAPEAEVVPIRVTVEHGLEILRG